MTTITKVLSRKWRIENLEAVPEDDHHRLANPANTSNFKYLIFEIPISVVSEEIPLYSYSRILGKQHCAFSRLIKHTTDNICGANTRPIEHAGKAVMISNLDCYRGKIFTTEKGVPTLTAVIVGESRSALETENVTAGDSARRRGQLVHSDGKGRLIPVSQIDIPFPLFWDRMCR